MEERKVAAIVPAYNEEKTIKDVVSILVDSGRFAEVVVISDGSTDKTAEQAREAGATYVHEMPWKHGKGAAMGHGVVHTSAPIVSFFDADLKGLTSEHVSAIIDPVLHGDRYMNIGMRDRGGVWNGLAWHLPLISGERAMRREIFEAIPDKYLSGFQVEVALNYFCRVNNLEYGAVPCKGLGIVRKMQKVGIVKGLLQYVSMSMQVLFAHARTRIAYKKFRERGTHMSHKH